MIKVYILRGLPGSGKSTLTAKIFWDHYNTEGQFVKTFSTDDYWIRPDGYYDWRGDRVKEAHQWNLNRFIDFVDTHNPAIAIVDNTNTTLKELLPYVDYGVAMGAEIKIVEPETWWKFDVEECAKRNTHRVPQDSIQRMLDRWETTQSIWKQLKEKYGESTFN